MSCLSRIAVVVFSVLDHRYGWSPVPFWVSLLGDALVVLGLALDSWLGLVVVALVLPALVWRILDEEKLLTNELSGYNEYAHRVRFRLVPFVW